MPSRGGVWEWLGFNIQIWGGNKYSVCSTIHPINHLSIHPVIQLSNSCQTSVKYTSPLSIISQSIQSLSRVWLFGTPWTAAHQASLSFTISQSLLKFMFIDLVTLSNHLILCSPLLLPSIFPSIRVFSNESALCIRWPKYWSYSFSISPSNEYSGLISFRMDWLDLLAVHDIY